MLNCLSVLLDDDLDYLCVIEFQNIIKYASFKLSGQIRNIVAYGDTSIKESQNDVKTTLLNGYAGFDTENQDGNFSKSSQTQGNNDKIRYLNFLNRNTKYFADFIYIQIKTKILMAIY